MKKILSLLLICALIAGCLIVFTACLNRTDSGSSRPPVASSRTGTGESSGTATNPGEPDGEDNPGEGEGSGNMSVTEDKDKEFGKVRMFPGYE